MSDRDRVIRLLAQVLNGTQVPRSLGMLGGATEPWDALREELDLFGYPDVDHHEGKLRAALDGAQVTGGQRQDSLVDQLDDLVRIAEHQGMRDAVDFLRRTVQIKSAVKASSLQYYGTVTGRLTTSKPNIQDLDPEEDEWNEDKQRQVDGG